MATFDTAPSDGLVRLFASLPTLQTSMAGLRVLPVKYRNTNRVLCIAVPDSPGLPLFPLQQINVIRPAPKTTSLELAKRRLASLRLLWANLQTAFLTSFPVRRRLPKCPLRRDRLDSSTSCGLGLPRLAVRTASSLNLMGKTD